jgi:hypothetical protein
VNSEENLILSINTGPFVLSNYYGVGYGDDISLDNSGDTILVLEVVPEPSTYALLLGGAVLGYAFWRRRK